MLKAVRLLCNARALCGADLVDHPIEKSEDGSAKKNRNIHPSQAQRYHDFLFEKALEYGPGKRDVVSWVVDRDRTTRNQARTLYLKGLPWGECLISCRESHSRLTWEISGVGIQDRVSLVRRTAQDDEADEDEPPKRGGGKGGSATAKRPLAEPKGDRRLEVNKDKACPDHNSREGCTRRQADCPHGKWHCCSRCGRHGHSAVGCRIAG